MPNAERAICTACGSRHHPWEPHHRSPGHPGECPDCTTPAIPMRVSISTANGPLTTITADRNPDQTVLGFLDELIHGLHESVEAMKAASEGGTLLRGLYRAPLTITVEEP